MFHLFSISPRHAVPKKIAGVLPLSLLLAGSVALSGCGGSRPQNDPYLQKKFEGIEKQLESVEKTARSVSILEQEMDHIATKIDGDMGLLGASLSPEQQDALAKLSASLQTIESLRAELDAAKAKIADLEKGGRSSSATPVSSNTTAIRSESGNAGRTVATSNTKPVPTKSAAKNGFYYRVQSSDTLSGVAQRHGVTIASLAQANRLPENAKLGVGQRLWIP